MLRTNAPRSLALIRSAPMAARNAALLVLAAGDVSQTDSGRDAP